MNRFHWEKLALPAISVVLGLFLLLRPWSATAALCSLIGWLILLAGGIGLVNALTFQRATLMTDPLLPASVAGVVIGLFFILSPGTLIEIVGLILCVFLMIEGVTNIQNAIARNRWGDGGWWVPLVVGILGIVLGLYALFAPFSSTQLITRLIGVMLLFSGAVNLFAALTGREE